MPTYSAVTKSIEDRFDTLWTNTPVAYKNVAPLDYDDVDKPVLADGSDPYIVTDIMPGHTENMEITNNPVRRTYGSLAVELYSKKDTGTATNQANIDALVALFEYQTIDNIVFREMVIMQDRTFGGWFLTPTLIRFHFDR